jgi:hypothetical protein
MWNDLLFGRDGICFLFDIEFGTTTFTLIWLMGVLLRFDEFTSILCHPK